MNQEERDIRLLEYWQGELLSPEEVREVESWLGEGGESPVFRGFATRVFASALGDAGKVG